jgi:predicted permease
MARWLIVGRMRLRSLLRRGRVDQELDKELRFHLDREAEQNLAAGMTPEQARRAALRRLGGFAQIQEECRDMRRTDMLESFGYDLRYALRALGRSPGFTAVMVLTLALSIGANSAIFSVIRGVLLRQLPYPHEDRIVRFFLSSAEYPKFPVNAFDFLDFRARNRAFDSMAIMSRADLQLSGVGEPQRLTGFRVSAGYFGVLGLNPQRGREFNVRDELPGNERVAILSDRLWRVRFNGDPNIVGAKIRLEGRPYTVVGVMTPQMQHPGNEYRPVPYGDTVDVWWPFTFAGDPSQRGSHYIEGVGRLKPGIALATADAEMNTIMAQLAREYPNNDSGWRVLVIPVYREIVGASERMLLVLLGAVGLVLLIACANAANLLLARATGRRREMAVRLALGAGRSRLIRQMLTESLLISVLGGACAAGVAVLAVKALVALLPAGFPRLHEIHVDLAVFAFTLAVALITGVFFGLAPALQSSRADVQQNLREGGRGAIGGARHLRLRNWLVISEVSLACVLLIGAGLLLRSFLNLMRTDPGFRAEHVLTAAVSLPEETYKNFAAVLRFSDLLLARLQSLPGVRAVGTGSDLPWTGYDDNLGGFQIEGKQPPPHESVHARYHMASPDYFPALGIPLIAGRLFTAADNLQAPPVLVINRAMAQRYWPGENVIGKRINFFNDHPKEKDWTTIVGVVGDVKDAPQNGSAEPAFWWPIAQTPFGFPSTMIAVRANSDPALLIGAVRDSVRELDPTLAVADVRLMERIAAGSMSAPRFTVFLVGLFASLAITLAAIGTYGVISYSVNQRMHEFGMRAALGAKPWDVLRLVLGQGVKLALAGVLIGVGCALALARVLRSLLYEVSSADPLTYFGVALMALAIAALACYIPARRATQADPMVALRTE